MDKKINKYIDHTLLKPEAKEADIIELCEQAKEYDFMSVCVQPYWVAKAASLLEDSTVKVCTVIGFPLGANTKEVKAFETENALKNGATEIDMVINIGALKSGDMETVEQEIALLASIVKDKGVLKVIIETCLLTDEEIIAVSQAVERAGADFVKTSTGFSTGGATVHAVKTIKKAVSNEMSIKASGGVSNYDDALVFIEAGANRLGTSKGIKLVRK